MICYVPLCFRCDFGSFILIIYFYSHNSVNLVIGISSMRLNEGSKQISSQIVASWYMTPYKKEIKNGRHLVCHQCVVDYTA